MGEKESSKKGPGKEEKGWWQLSQHMPGEKLDVVLWSAGGAAVLFLVLWIVWVSVASGRATRLAEAEAKVGDLQKKVDSRREAAEVEKWRKMADEEAAARQEADAKVKGLDTNLKRAESARDSLQRQLDKANKGSAALERKLSADLGKAKDDLKRVQNDLNSLRRAASDVDALNRRLKATEEALSKTKKDLSALREVTKGTKTEKDRMNKELQRLSREYESKMTVLKGQIEERTRRIDDLSLKLAEFPSTPLTEEQAESRYREIWEELGSVTDRDQRIERLLKAKQELAGSRYERSANRDWQKEKKLKQRDIDKAAADVYKKALSEIRAHSQAYDENIAILKKALEDENVANSRYKRSIDKLITKQTKLKAAADAREKAAEEAAAAAAEKEPEEELVE